MHGRAMTPIGMWSLLGAASGYSPSSPSSAMSTIRDSGLSIIALSLTRYCKPHKAKGATLT
jgi:hypothetical protein